MVTTIAETHFTETERQALLRLLAKAKAEGVTLMRAKDGRHFASSVSQPGTLHYVTGLSCDCRGFVSHGRCKHHAALLSALGWLQDAMPATIAPLAIACAHVAGHYTLAAEPEWIDPRTEIMIDGDVKVRITGDTFGLSVHWIEQGRPIDDMTGCTPSYLDHYGAVSYWIESLDDRVSPHVAMQQAGIFPAGEFVDAHEAA